MHYVLASLVFVLSSCGLGDFDPSLKPKPGAPGMPGMPGEPGTPGNPGADALIESVSCTLDWKYEDTNESKRGMYLHYVVMTFKTGDVLAGLTRIYYNNDFTQKQNVAALWPSDYKMKEAAHVGDSVFSAHLKEGKAIFTLQATGEKKEVPCATN